MKACRVCGESKPLDAFSKNARAKDGLQVRCKECVKVYMRARQVEKRDQLAAKAAAKRAAMTPEQRESQREYMRAYYEANREKFVVTDPERIAAHRERAWRRHQDPEARMAKRERDREAYRANPEPYKESAMRRRSRVQEATVAEFTERDWLRIVARQDGNCHYCGARGRLTQDHLIPICRGGLNTVGNVVGACRACNLQKGRKTRMEYRAWLRRMAVV